MKSPGSLRIADWIDAFGFGKAQFQREDINRTGITFKFYGGRYQFNQELQVASPQEN